MTRHRDDLFGTPAKKIIVEQSSGALVSPSLKGKLEETLLEEEIGFYDEGGYNHPIKRIRVDRNNGSYDLLLDYSRSEKMPIDIFSFYNVRVNNRYTALVLDFETPNGEEVRIPGVSWSLCGVYYGLPPHFARNRGTKILEILENSDNPELKCRNAVAKCLLDIYQEISENREISRQEYKRGIRLCRENKKFSDVRDYEDKLNHLVRPEVLERIKLAAEKIKLTSV